jgi:glycosyltransferase involved in cell wall biosynthesis
MLVSIVTPSYNQGEFIEATLQSIQKQTYPTIEHIVVDNCSTDSTKAVLDRYGGEITTIIEPDNGQTDAINKGMRRASGEIMAWLNADDLYLPQTVRTVVDFFNSHPEALFVYGDVEAIDRDGKSYGVRPFIEQTDADELVHVRNRIVQPAAFWRRTLWEQIGELDTTLHYVMDYEYWMRTARHTQIRYIPVILAQERLYDAAKTFRGTLKRIRELEEIGKRHGGEGLPENFKAEAAATYLLHRDFRSALELRPPFAKLVKHLIAQGLPSQAGAWLLLTRLTGKSRSQI